jgi:hypothetical protein
MPSEKPMQELLAMQAFWQIVRLARGIGKPRLSLGLSAICGACVNWADESEQPTRTRPRSAKRERERIDNIYNVYANNEAKTLIKDELVSVCHVSGSHKTNTLATTSCLSIPRLRR